MKKIFVTIITISLLSNNLVLAHCQIPCGIYDDALRIIIMKENFQTIKKSMEHIQKLSSLSDHLSKNQITRWINTKESHAQDVQNIISEYFLTQRIKHTDIEYINKLKLLHKLLVVTMKCKQTTNISYVTDSIILIDEFSKLYFDRHGLDHLEKLSK